MKLTNPDGITGEYEIDEEGNVYSYQKKKTLSQTNNGNGYMTVTLNNTKFYVHRLVAQTYIDKPEGKNDVNHKDGDKSNNSAKNLEWVSKSENIRHAYDSGLFKKVYDKMQETHKSWIGTKLGKREIVEVLDVRNKVGNYKVVTRCDCGNLIEMWQNDFKKNKHLNCRKC